MPYDDELADRVRALLDGDPDVTEKRMFGGLAFLTGGHMAVAASGQGGLMVRVAPDETDALLAEPGARPMEMRGRELDGWVRVDAGAVEDDAQLEAWVARGTTYARSLPPKG
jgi:TfoX/Sxy family transcriptional regulator of competence genes